MAPEGAADDELVRRFAGGDEGAFTELMQRHEDRIFALAFRMTGNRSDALDATQETFIAAYRRISAFRGESAFSTWLYRIGINACRDLLRSRARQPALSEEPPLEARNPPATPLDEAVGLRLDLARALAALPDEYREAVALHDLGGLPYEEIARVTGANLGTVKSRISRGRRRLAELMEQGSDRRPSKGRK